MKHDFIKNAKVNVESSTDKKKRKTAIITVGDGTGEKYQHQFPHVSRISKALDVMTPGQLAERLTGGSYFFVEDTLYDFREGNYKGHIQSDETILQLKDLLGINVVTCGCTKTLHRVALSLVVSGLTILLTLQHSMKAAHSVLNFITVGRHSWLPLTVHSNWNV